MKTKRKNKQWCPMEGTGYEGLCLEGTATIRVKSAKCNKRHECQQLKEQLDRKKNES
jgi:hypothetical protein